MQTLSGSRPSDLEERASGAWATPRSSTPNGGLNARPRILLTVDLEDWHQLVGRAIHRPDWDKPHDEFERQADDTLSLLRELGARATFFVLGITARNHPGVVERIAADAHEVACHGWAHVPAWKQTAGEFRRDVEDGLSVLEAIGAPPPSGYRAPVFSLTSKTPWAFRILAELGFRYDSSHYDSPLIPDRFPAARSAYRIEARRSATVLELPVAVARIAGRSLPIGGGSYWRVLPGALIMRGLEQLAAEPGFPVLYFHPYELGRQPLRIGLPPASRARVRAAGAWKTLRYNPRRARVAALLAQTAERFQLVSCEEALRDIDGFRRSSWTKRAREGTHVTSRTLPGVAVRPS
jgi:polysaccharide deacetylase family protein (PEP-CTERM system associated)